MFDCLIQMSSALTPPPFRDVDRDGQRRHSRFKVLTTDYIERLEREFASNLVPDADSFELQRCDLTEAQPSHTWLGQMSRHAALALGEEFESAEGDPGIPALLNWDRRVAVPAPWRSFLRAQRPATPDGLRIEPGADPDCNDYLVSLRALPDASPEGEPIDTDTESAPRLRDGADEQRLLELRRFVAKLYAQRRTRIFASHLSDRIYNLWLAPGVVRPRGEAENGLVMLPFVTRVRRPFEAEFRRTISFSIVFVPVAIGADGAEGPRKLSVSEINQLITSLGGASTHVPEHADDQFELIGGPMCDYLNSLGMHDAWPVSKSLAASALAGAPPAGTMRQWVELLYTASCEAMFASQGCLGRAEGGPRGSALADEILKAIRMSTAWSTLVLSDDLQPFEAGTSQVVDGVWWPPRKKDCLGVGRVDSGVPEKLQALLRGLVSDSTLPVTSVDRVDDMECGMPSALIWRIAQLQCVVTAYHTESEHFPGVSALYLFSWMSHALVGVTSLRAMVGALGLESERSGQSDVVSLAETSHRLTLEMEEMFDLNVAWPEYGHLYERLRAQLGIANVYRRARDRLDRLSQYADIVIRTEQNRDLEMLQWIAGLLAVGIIGVGIVQVFATESGHLAGWISIAVALVTLALVLLRFYLRGHPPRSEP